jgi:hypothetical protein
MHKGDNSMELNEEMYDMFKNHFGYSYEFIKNPFQLMLPLKRTG